VDEDDDGGFGFDLGVDDEGLDGAVAVLEVDVLVVAGRGVEAGLGPVLRVEGSGGERQEQSGGEEFEGAGRGYRHGEESSTKRAGRQDGAGDFSRGEKGTHPTEVDLDERMCEGVRGNV
jgi:hypothetical protein